MRSDVPVMTGLLADDELEIPAHIPGSGIDFSAVAGLYVATPDEVRPGVVPVAQRGGIRLAATERLRRIDRACQTGDIVVTVDGPAGALRLGRPMQVLAAAAGSCIALDDPSLGPPRRFDWPLAYLLRLGSVDEAAVWDALAVWGVCRCPRCQAPGLELIYGMTTGPAPAGQVLGGCSRLLLSGDTACSRCTTTWSRRVPDPGSLSRCQKSARTNSVGAKVNELAAMADPADS